MFKKKSVQLHKYSFTQLYLINEYMYFDFYYWNSLILLVKTNRTDINI